MILPRPGEGFEWRDTPFGAALVCTALDGVAAHAFTTRQWALAAARDAGAHAWAQVAAALDRPPGALVRMRQVHGRTVIVADTVPAAGGDLPEADIALSRDPALIVAAQAADCVPMLVADRRRGVVAAAHAGWRGLAAGVPRVAIEALERTFGSAPHDLVVAFGPSVGSCCYEVGPDVRAAFDAGAFLPEQLERWFLPSPSPSDVNPSMPGLPPVRRPGHAYFDGWACAFEQAQAAGVPAEGIFTARLCTASHPDVFCSYRRDGRAAGRIAGAIRAGVGS